MTFGFCFGKVTMSILNALQSFHILLSRAEPIDTHDVWKVPRHSQLQRGNGYMSYILSENAYFSLEERHKPRVLNVWLVFLVFMF